MMMVFSPDMLMLYLFEKFKTFVFSIDVRTNVCYNIFSATILGRRLVLPIEDCDL